MCCSKGIVKRFIPFLITLGVGLLIASFFVPILPNLSFGGGRQRHREWHQQMERDKQNLLDENYNLKLQLDEMRKNQLDRDWSVNSGPQRLLHELPPEPPPPPIPNAPVAPKKSR